MKSWNLFLFMVLAFFECQAAKVELVDDSLATSADISDVIIILDPSKQEKTELLTHNNVGALINHFALCLYEQAVPIIVSGSIVNSFLRLAQDKKNREQLALVKRIFRIPSTTKFFDDKSLWEKIPKNLQSPFILSEFYRFKIPLIAQTFTNENWYGFASQTADLVLLIPKKYIIRMNMAIPRSSDAAFLLAAQCGFNVNPDEKEQPLVAIPDLSLDTLAKKLKDLDDENSEEYGSQIYIESVMDIFNPKPTKKWNIYMIGHGWYPEAMPLKEIKNKMRELKKALKEKYTQIKEARLRGKKTMLMESRARRLKNSLHELEASLGLGGITTEKSYIAGLKFNDFKDLLGFFRKNNTLSLYYVSCFASGYNQYFTSKILKELSAPYLTFTQGIPNALTYIQTFLADCQTHIDERGNVEFDKYQNFLAYFTKLRLFFESPSTFTSISRKSKIDPLVSIIQTVSGSDIMARNGQPFVSVPRVGVFSALNVDKKVKILTKSLVKRHEFEGSLIDAKAQEAICIYPSRINVPLECTLTGNTRICSLMLSQDIEKHGSSKGATHFLQELICVLKPQASPEEFGFIRKEGMRLLMRACLRYQPMWKGQLIYPTTFLIKKLTFKWRVSDHKIRIMSFGNVVIENVRPDAYIMKYTNTQGYLFQGWVLCNDFRNEVLFDAAIRSFSPTLEPVPISSNQGRLFDLRGEKLKKDIDVQRIGALQDVLRKKIEFIRQKELKDSAVIDKADAVKD